ncbi:RTA1 like protein-domain-containing protein [Ilyonectria robusta]|uniref:RTA1 like protein-domain-containing protein n=1 Tax=Ilyonectria robusta TaxID=1079257 RepID=UPI001E8E79DD|nr:RTA1 like protein-domain-containing protein [Ilyonectria robusta]KAH8654158.1 RTA1 like protein-domain-containing protein [Ilyonectria robusta]
MGNSSLLDPVEGVEPTKGSYYLWRYAPNKGAAALFLLLFLASFFYICWRIYKTRTRFCIVFAIGCFYKQPIAHIIVEVIGYGARISSANQTGRIITYTIQSMYILVAPALFAASIYITLGRIIISVRGEKYSLIRPTRLTKTFVTGDILTFMIQGGAAGIIVVQNATLAKWGERIVILGLIVQVLLFGLFTAIAVVFHHRLRKSATTDSFNSLIPWESTLYMLYIVSALIIVQSIFRVVEYAQGQTGYCLSHEWTIYVFDSLLMFLVAVLFSWRFPSGLKPREFIPV